MICTLCHADLDHCHDVLVLHLDGSVECSDRSCEGQFESHEWATSCADMRWACDCSRIGHTQPLAA